MTRLSLFRNELENEAVATKKMLAAVPDDQYDWKPHPKSMSIRQLTTHIAELPSWIGMILNTTELDFATMDYKPTPISSTAQLGEVFERNLTDGLSQLTNGKEDTLDEPWTLRNAEQVYSVEPRATVIRSSVSQIIHHRAQLGVFLRLLDVPIPGTYGPSADETF
ncbi:MAG: DinB family protein [Chitinophagaceae bacterium]